MKILAALTVLVGVAIILGSVSRSRAHHTVFTYQVERFEIVGNVQAGSAVDEFDDDLLTGWGVQGTVIESGGVVTLTNPGIHDDQRPVANAMLDRSLIGPHPSFVVEEGHGDFTATATWVPLLPQPPGGFLALALVYPLRDASGNPVPYGPDVAPPAPGGFHNESIVIAVSNLSPELAAEWGIVSGPAILQSSGGQTCCAADPGGNTTLGFSGSSVPFDPNDVTGNVVTFGPDLTPVIVPLADATSQEAKCQYEVAIRTQKVLDLLWSEARKAKKNGLRGRKRVTTTSGDVPVGFAEELGAEIDAYLALDERGRVGSSEDRLTNGTIVKCASLPAIAGTFPGRCAGASTWSEFAVCASQRARCRFCEAINSVDGTGLDCSAFFDGDPSGDLSISGTCP